jgi:hypothetical protein
MHHHDPKIDVLRPGDAGAGRQSRCPLDINGTTFLVKRDIWVTVPYRIFLVLKDAVQTIYNPVQDDLGRLSRDPRRLFLPLQHEERAERGGNRRLARADRLVELA